MVVSVLIIIAVLSTKLSSRLGLPLLIGFILIGIVVGSDVLNLVSFNDAGLSKSVADILLMFIIFDGGFRVTRESFKAVAGPSMTLATLGVALTAVILALFIHLVLGIELVSALLIASIISSTDAAAVFMITKANPIKPKLATTLNVESAANDPMAILLTVTFIQVATQAFDSPIMAILDLLWKFAGGFLVGFVAYKISMFIFKNIKSDSRGNYNVLIIACVLLAYGGAELALANGIIAVFFMGYWLGNSHFPAKRGVSNFMETISTTSNIALFVMLGLLASPARFVAIWPQALVIVAIMMFVARPLAIMLSLIPFKYTVKEKAFLMLGGIKGAVPIVLATYPLAAGLDGDGFIFDTIFFAVALSCIIQGSTLGPAAKLFGFTEKRRPESPHSIELHSLASSDMDMVEIHVEENSPWIDVAIANLKLEKDVLISSIVRDGQLVLPKGTTVIKGNDILYVLAHSSKINDINAQINTPAET